MKKFSLIIPVYNEESAIIESITKIINQLSEYELQYELIVVNDGSTDNTNKLLNEIKYDLKIINHEKNKGYGAAIKTGIIYANNDYIVITDADGTYPNERIYEFFNLIIKDDFDMIVGSRTGSNVKIPLIRKPAKWFIGKLANYVTNVNIPDINSGLRIFKKSSFMSFIQIIPDGFSLTTTITLGMISNGYRVKFIPIDYFHRIGSSKIKPIKDTMNFIVLIFKIGLYFAPMKIFFPIGGLLLLLSCGLALYSLIFLGKLADVSEILKMF